MSKKRGIIIAVVIAVAAAAGILFWRLSARGVADDSAGTAYVQSVAQITGSGSGVLNRYAGVVESQETWSVAKNMETTVDKVLVNVGDEVKAGDALFTYNTEKYQDDLSQAQIDLERQNNELASIISTIDQLEKEKAKASAADQANYTIQIQEQQLSQKQKELDIRSKQTDIQKLQDNIKNATVTSQIDGVVQSINSGNDNYSSDNSFITIMKTGDLRIKGTINEQNVYDISEGAPVIIHSRRDDTTWKGTIVKIDTEKKEQDNNGMYYSSSGDDVTSSKYPFYVELNSSDGLMMGQHVYMELDYGQQEARQGLWLSEYYIDMTDAAHPFVWADNGSGALEKRELTLGEHDEEMMEYQITGGLSEEDEIAFPDAGFKEGMKTAPISEQVFDENGGAEPADDGYTYMNNVEPAGDMGSGVIGGGTTEAVPAQ